MFVVFDLLCLLIGASVDGKEFDDTIVVSPDCDLLGGIGGGIR